jgi:hypothetical protein
MSRFRYNSSGALPLVLALCFSAQAAAQDAPARVFDVRDYGAMGQKADSAQAAIQSAIDAAAAAGGGTVYFPAGEYTSGTLHLKSHVRLYIESGATIFSVKDKAAFDQEALIFGADLENVTIEGRGTIDGQAGYEWRPDDIEDDFIRPNEELMLSLGKSTNRSFPKKDQFGKLILLLRCTDVRIAGLSLIDSPSWTIHPYGCERLVIDGVYIRSSRTEGVWADGIDPDGCKDVRISNCTIETGDDALVFYSMNWFGPARPCENITVTNCRLTSASSAIKFCDGNMNCIRNVTIDNCVITGANRGIAFMDFDGGYVSDVVLSNLTIECVRHDWFWWGDGDPLHFNIKRRSEVHKSVAPGSDAPAGAIRRVLISNVIARGQGSSICNGHPDSWLEDITIDNLKLYITADPQAPYDKSRHALEFRQVRNLKLNGVEVFWGEPASPAWRSAIYLEDIHGLVLDRVTARQAQTDAQETAIVLERVRDALIRNCTAQPGTWRFLNLLGESTKEITLFGNDFRQCQGAWTCGEGVPVETIRELSNIPPPK